MDKILASIKSIFSSAPEYGEHHNAHILEWELAQKKQATYKLTNENDGKGSPYSINMSLEKITPLLKYVAIGVAIVYIIKKVKK